jgi:glyoxylase-like metal-dependent hydrolase (beta-lactamase superfamily II)
MSAHAAGHAALLIEERGVLVTEDMLSDALIPMLDLNDAGAPIEDYLAALRLIEGVGGRRCPRPRPRVHRRS